MSESEPRERIINFDPLWSTMSRVYRVGDVSLGRRGVPQQVLVYAVVGLLFSVAVLFVPVVGAIPGAVMPGVVWVVGVTGLAGVLGAWRPGGTPVHVLAPVLVRFLFRDRVLLGWVPLGRPEAAWRPDDLVLQDDGSRPTFVRAQFTGPGRLVRAFPAARGRGRRTLVDLALGRAPRQWLRQQPADALDEPRVTDVPAGVRVQIEPAD